MSTNGAPWLFSLLSSLKVMTSATLSVLLTVVKDCTKRQVRKPRQKLVLELLNRGWQTFSVKDYMGNSLAFVGGKVSIGTTQLDCCSTKTAIHNV